jgi:hypothetical protein
MFGTQDLKKVYVAAITLVVCSFSFYTSEHPEHLK